MSLSARSNKDSTRDYWAAATQQPFVTTAFSRTHFFSVVRNLRVNDPEDPEAESDDRLAKLRQLLDLMEGNILQYFYPMRELSVDEAMVTVGFKRRSIMRQHIARKASPTGFKVWMLVDISTNYVCAFDVYTGAKPRRKDEQMTQKVVTRLLARLEQNRYHLIGMDKFFTSVALFEKLLAIGFYAVGAARADRELFPRQLAVSIEGCQRGEWVWRQLADSPLTVVSWMDKKPVHLLSTCSDPCQQTIVRRWTGDEHASVSCPEVLPLYVKAMRGVDVFSQRQSYSKLGRRSRKWFYSLVWFIDIAIHNAYILYQNKHQQSHFSQKDFRKALMQQLVGGHTSRKCRAAPLKRPHDSLHRLQHVKQQGTCVRCAKTVRQGGHNKRSSWRCEDCQNFSCVPNCYNEHIQALAEQHAGRATCHLRAQSADCAQDSRSVKR